MTMLKRLMYQNGLNQTDLASRLGVVPSTVSCWIAGRRDPQPKYIPRMAKILNVSAADLTRVIAPDTALN